MRPHTENDQVEDKLDDASENGSGARAHLILNYLKKCYEGLNEDVTRHTVLLLGWEWKGGACESSFGLALPVLDAPTDSTDIGVDIVSLDFTSEVIGGVGVRYGLYSGTCSGVYGDAPKFSAE